MPGIKPRSGKKKDKLQESRLNPCTFILRNEAPTGSASWPCLSNRAVSSINENGAAALSRTNRLSALEFAAFVRHNGREAA